LRHRREEGAAVSFLCGLDDDGNPTAINIANAQAVSLVGDRIMVEWDDTGISRTVQARGATTCGEDMLIPVLDLFSQKASKKP
jgi:hypothetical protein